MNHENRIIPDWNFIVKTKTNCMRKTFTTLVLTGLVSMAGARNHMPSKSSDLKTTSTLQTRVAGCSPAQAQQIMEFNNVSALIAQGGLNFRDRANNRAHYEIPKGGGASAVYANSLYMGGLDYNGQLKLAATLTFREFGEDYWPGPLIEGPATVTSAVCSEYDKIYYANRSEVLAFYNDFQADGSVASIPTNIANWPTVFNGEPLAPFYDANNDELYNPSDGDMPWYQFKGTATELGCSNDRRVTLYGDQTYWWVFNDKGNIHTESGGDPIGMEIHAQAFAFNTDDEVNNMTFYNYELINRSTQTLYNTYFGNFFDFDLGNANDDYAGCDVQRGLGYVYNADEYDEPISGASGYGYNPPAIGVDYFEGPFQDEDGIANQIEDTYAAAMANGGIPYKGLGIGYDDSIKDNERFGMRKFAAYTGFGSVSTAVADPANAANAYFYLTGHWNDGTDFTWGDDGYGGSVPVDYLYYYDTDPKLWASKGTPVPLDWREDIAGNNEGDRRVLSSAGPFTLQPGATNNITIGVIYARTPSGIPFNSVDPYLEIADDKAQALFDNCFKILEGPYAPDVTAQELSNEIILMLTNDPIKSNNKKDDYSEFDPFTILPDIAPFNDSTLTQNEKDSLYRTYRFEGYKIFQLANDQVGSGDLNDPDKARMVAQVDVKNDISKIINWARDNATGFVVPTLMVDGENKGVKHSFKITTDAFTQATLINHKTYYYMAVAYAYNEFLPYDQATGIGQQKPYLQSRKNVNGDAVQIIKVIPHIPSPENGGTLSHAQYGDGPVITRIEGKGNGGLDVYLTAESENEIITNVFAPHPQYYGGEGKGPIEVKVIDPLNVTDHQFRVIFHPEGTSLNNATWTLVDMTTGDSYDSNSSIDVQNEQIFPQYGFSISISQWFKSEICTSTYWRTELVRSEIMYTDKDKVWIQGIADQEGNTPLNWIRSGTVTNTGDVTLCEDAIYDDYSCRDDEQAFEKILGGTIAPYQLCARAWNGNNGSCAVNAPINSNFNGSTSASFSGVVNFGVKTMRSLELVLTNDRSKWTRCPVLETTDNAEWGATQFDQKQTIKELPSRDKYGNTGDGVVTTNLEDADYIAATGMSWFPGYVIDVESGVRLNVAFGEDSRYAVDNGRDMLWNPTATTQSDLGEHVWGGKHYLYIFGNSINDLNFSSALRKVPPYDNGFELQNNLRATSTTVASMSNFWASCSYVWIPTMATGFTMNSYSGSPLPSDARISIRVKKPFEQLNTSGTSFDVSDVTGATNNWFNVYEFSMGSLASQTQQTQALADSILSLINVVPNPYYAYSTYENNRLDNRIKIVNLPDECNIKIYNTSGGLIRTLSKSTNTITSVDWDLKNQKGVPIAGGVYLIQVEAPGLGQRVLKWFGALRPADLDNF